MFLEVYLPLSEAYWRRIDDQDSFQGHQEGQGYRPIHFRHSASFLEHFDFYEIINYSEFWGGGNCACRILTFVECFFDFLGQG